MDHRIDSATRRSRLTAVVVGAGLIGATLLAQPVFAQQPKPAAPAQPAPAAPAAPAQGAAPQAAAPQLPPLMYSSWVKLCQQGAETDNKKVCVVHRDGRMENGMPVVMTELLQVEGAQERLRVTVPMTIIVRLAEGTHLVLDNQDMGTAPYMVCTQVGCLSDYAASPDLVKKLKAGKQLIVQTYLMNGQVLSIPVSLADFAKAYDGPATDPKVVEEQQRKLQEEMQKKAEEARKKLEAQQPAAAAPAAPAPAKKP
jgi:invasion protein IalB